MMMMIMYNVIYLLSFIPKARVAKNALFTFLNDFFFAPEASETTISNNIKVYTILLKILLCRVIILSQFNCEISSNCISCTQRGFKCLHLLAVRIPMKRSFFEHISSEMRWSK